MQPTGQLRRPPRGRVLRNMQAAFALRVLRADLGNFFLLEYRRQVDGYLITGKNSGTHWVKFMLSCAFAHHYGVAPPPHASGPDSDTIISHPRHPHRYPQIPRIGSSHTIPSGAFAWRMPWLRPLPTVVLVRDIRDALLSNFIKWRETYGVSLAAYLRGDPSGRQFVADVWWYIHFFNRWGDVAVAWPGDILIVRYEDVAAAPGYWLGRIAGHWGIELADAAIAAALPYVERDALRTRLDPSETEIVIPEAAARRSLELSAGDIALLDEMFRRHLRHALQYPYPTRHRRAGGHLDAAAAPHIAE